MLDLTDLTVISILHILRAIRSVHVRINLRHVLSLHAVAKLSSRRQNGCLPTGTATVVALCLCSAIRRIESIIRHRPG